MGFKKLSQLLFQAETEGGGATSTLLNKLTLRLYTTYLQGMEQSILFSDL
jgi:hypothetical protein